VKDASACGNPRIDGLAVRGRLMSVWDRLLYREPTLRPHTEAIWAARKDGRIRRLVEREARYALLLTNQQCGPRSDAEWSLLAQACLEAIGVTSAKAVLRDVA
jgi:hypothetical protein